MRHLWADIRYAVRMLVKHPTLSVTAIVTFGLGIGLTTTVFSIVNGALYKGLPFDQAERIVSVIGTNPSQNIQRMPLAVQDLAVLEERQTVFEAAGLYASMPVNLSVGNDRPERFSAGQFTVGAFKAVGVDPILGRGFQEGDDKAAIESRSEALAERSGKLAERLYSQSGDGDGGAAGGAEGGSQAGAERDDVVDAEFEEVKDERK